MDDRIKAIYLWVLSEPKKSEAVYYNYFEQEYVSLRYMILDLGIKLYI